MTIQQKCDELNRRIHDKLFLSNYLSASIGDYKRVITSIDLIEDSENAIEEFENIAETNFQNRSTLYIYGVLQSMYCQQDGLFHLFKTTTKKLLRNVYELFELYNFNKSIREVRDDIAGHPADRKNGKEFYFIVKLPNTKYRFSYVGYTPRFRKVEVDLRQFIEEQREFTTTVLNDIEKTISEQIQMHKDKFKIIKLTDLVNNLNYPTQLIYRGIFNNHASAEIGLAEIREKLEALKIELGKRYNKQIPDGILDIYRIQDHILLKVGNWITNKELEGNTDAEVFMDSFNHQIDELIKILKEIECEYEK
jgi:hypothetical protein